MAVVETAWLCSRTVQGSAGDCSKLSASPVSRLWHVKLSASRLVADALNVRVGHFVDVGQVHSCLSGAADPDVVRILCQKGRLEEAVGALDSMEQQGLVAPLEAYGLLLQECGKRKSLAEARLVQAHLARNGLDSNGYLGNQLVGAFVQCGSHSDALRVLQCFPNRSVASWTAVISGYANMGQDQEALAVYKQMVKAGLEPNKYTFLSALKACVSLLDLEQGRKVHADLMKCSCASDVFVGTALLGMYAKCGSTVDARSVFDMLSKRDVVSWNAMISGYAQQEQGEQALELYARMQNEGVQPNDRTFVSLLKACGILALEEEAAFVNRQLVKVNSLVKGALGTPGMCSTCCVSVML